MKSIWFLLVLSLVFVACEQQEQLPEYVEEGIEQISEQVQVNDGVADQQVDDGSGGDDQNTDDHDVVDNGDDEMDTPPPTDIKATVALSSSSESMLLGSEDKLTVTVATDADFPGGDIELSVDRSNLNGANDDDKYVLTSLAQTTISGMGANETRQIDLDLEIKTMARSFPPTELKVVITQNGFSKDASLMLEVQPNIEVAVLAPQADNNSPHMWNRGLSTCMRTHPTGVGIIFVNRSNNFASGSEPCVHTGGPLAHCNTGNRMSFNETYDGGRRVTADANRNGAVENNDTNAAAVYYDHFESTGDSIGRRLFFNVVPGTETTVGRNGNNCE